MERGSSILRWFALVTLTALLLPLPIHGEAGGSLDSIRRLRITYEKRSNALEHTIFRHPLYLESSRNDKTVRGEVISVLDHPFDGISQNLVDPGEWCDILLLHLNIKACTHTPRQQRGHRLNLYIGRKSYQSPNESHKQTYTFHATLDRKRSYLKITMSSPRGPLDTYGYNILMDAIPVGKEHTFIRFRFSYSYGSLTDLAVLGYLNTTGRNKVGFSIASREADGTPVYIKGIRAALERNVMRYYLAILAHLSVDKEHPDKQHFSISSRKWFLMTEEYKKQLHELSMQEYIKTKEREWQNQKSLQKRLPANPKH